MNKSLIFFFIIVISINTSYSQNIYTDEVEDQKQWVYDNDNKTYMERPCTYRPKLNYIKDIEEELKEVRDGYGYLTIGIADLFGLGLGYQLDDVYSLGIKWGIYWTSSKGGRPEGGPAVPNGGAGFGIRFSRSLNNNIFNNINFETTFFHTISENNFSDFIKGGAIDVNIGNENHLQNGQNFIWSLGLVSSFANGVSPLFLPNLKIGININF